MKISLLSLFWLVTWMTVVVAAASFLIAESLPGKSDLPKLIPASIKLGVLMLVVFLVGRVFAEKQAGNYNAFWTAFAVVATALLLLEMLMIDWDFQFFEYVSIHIPVASDANGFSSDFRYGIASTIRAGLIPLLGFATGCIAATYSSPRR